MHRPQHVCNLRAGFLLCLAVILMAGCAPRTPQVDNFMGTSSALAHQSQIAYPKAGVTSQPLSGMEGQVGEKVMARYYSGFDEKAPKTTVYTLNVNGGGK